MFEDRVVVVTGGSRGLGRAMASAFASAGASVVVASRKADACAVLAEELQQRTGWPALGVGCHVGRWQDCDALVETVMDNFGRVDVLINNAGMSPLYASLDTVTEELFDKVVAVNLKGPFRLSSTIGGRMVEAGGGVILNIGSIAGHRPTPDELPYAMAKAGLDTLTLGLAKAFAPTVRVNAIVPGMFATDVAKAWDPEMVADAERRRIPMGRVGHPDEVVGAALHLASDDAAYTTGATLRIDGGMAI